MSPTLRYLATLLLSAVCAHAAGSSAGDGEQKNWPRFRGPGGNGVCLSGDAATSFDVATGTNVLWSAEVPAEGFSSPIIWGDRVFLTGGDKTAREMFCYALESGKLLWRSKVPDAAGSDGMEIPDQCGMAASTPATDGQRAYAIFSDGSVTAWDFEGRVQWSKQLGVPKNAYGHAASLLTWGGRVIVPFDQGEADDHLSHLYAFDGATGEQVWKQPRPVGASWATPITLEAAGRAQIITLAVPWVISYAPADGKELWRADCLDGDVTPSPVFAGGTLFAVHPSSKLQSLRPDGVGDVTQSHLGWMAEDGIPDISSPVSHDGLVFLVDSGGVATCYDATTGRKQWTHDLEEDCNASPSIVGGKLYIISKKGSVIVLAAGREFQELGRSSVQEKVLASPAFARGRMVIRGAGHLFCIGAKAAQ